MPNVILDSRFEDCILAARIAVWLPQDRISKLLLRFPICTESEMVIAGVLIARVDKSKMDRMQEKKKCMKNRNKRETKKKIVKICCIVR